MTFTRVQTWQRHTFHVEPSRGENFRELLGGGAGRVVGYSPQSADYPLLPRHWTASL